MNKNLSETYRRSDILPQLELVCAILEQAIGQVSGKIATREEDRRDARRFIYSDRLDAFIDNWNLSIEPEYIRRITKKQIKIYKTRGL